jgi:proteic killer suppression protein
VGVIVSFQDQCSCDIFTGENTKEARKVPKALHRKAKLMLEVLNAAHDVQDMASPPGNRLHKLSGDLKGFWSVSVNGQFRIIFTFEGGNASEVCITDYH